MLVIAEKEKSRLSRAVRRIYRPISKLQSDARVFADYGSWRTHQELRGRSAKLDEAHLHSIRVRALGNLSVYCRPNTTDVDVFDDTFFGQYHLPPTDLSNVRTILDLGSNIGLTLAHFAVLFPHARVLGVEMDAGNVAVCRRNIQTFGVRCRVIHGAVWTSEGSVSYEGLTQWGFRVTGPGRGGTRVRSFTIPQLLDDCGAEVVDFVKMDVEAAEEQLLDAVGTWISRVRCLKVEVHEPFTVERCVATLERVGLDCSRDISHRACVIARNPQHGD